MSGRRPGTISTVDVVRLLDLVGSRSVAERPHVHARAVIQTLHNFSSSADAEIIHRHLPFSVSRSARGELILDDARTTYDVVKPAPDNRLWLFYVSVSLGGWAGSSINAMYSADYGRTWSVPRQLITSPFLNISTLVRSAPVFHEDGSIGLPVYHEFLGKFAEYLYLSPDGRVVDKFRISRGDNALQPTIVPLDSRRAVAMLRYAGDVHHRVLASETGDAGRTWSEPRPVDPFNPNSSLAAIRTPDDGLIVALNDLRDGRFRLSLYGTDVGMNSWQPLTDLDESPDPEGDLLAPDIFRGMIEQQFLMPSGAHRRPLLPGLLTHLDQRVCKMHGCEFEFEYPYFSRGADGLYHLVYSWNNMLIKHVSFNDAWLEGKR